MSDDGENDERSEGERYNDEHIAPRLAAIAKECADNGLYFVARVEWASFEGQTTMQRAPPGAVSASHEMAYLASRTNGNIDALIISLAKAHNDGLLNLDASMLSTMLKLRPFQKADPQPQPPPARKP